MAELTQAQKAIADAMIAGTFDKLGAPPAYMQPAQSVDDMYSGIIPSGGKYDVFADAAKPPAINFAGLAAAQQGTNLLDPGNANYVDPTMTAYAPTAPASPGPPAVAAANAAVQPQTTWLQDMMKGINSPGQPQAEQQAPVARQPFQTLGQIITRANDPVSRSAASQGVNASGNYYNLDTNKWVMQGAGGKIDGNPDNSTFSPDDSSGMTRWQQFGFGSRQEMDAAERAWIEANGQGSQQAFLASRLAATRLAAMGAPTASGSSVAAPVSVGKIPLPSIAPTLRSMPAGSSAMALQQNLRRPKLPVVTNHSGARR